MKLPKLYKLTSTGKVQTWKISVEGIGHTDHFSDGYEIGEITTVYGLEFGKKQVATEKITKGKNVGKVNSTTPYEQACAEAQSQWEQKVKKGYVENIEDAKVGKIDTNTITGGIDPMLAHKYEQQGHKIKYPAFAQPKLDGHRCIAIVQDGVCTLWSRTRKPIKSMPHIVDYLEKMFVGQDIILDGELYNHDYRDNFEDLTSKIKQSSPKPGHEVVQYWIYDVVNGDTFKSRRKELDVIMEKVMYVGAQNTIVVVPTSMVKDEEEMISVFGAYIENEFEGLMVRNAEANYKNKRSYDLQKVKMMADAEFPIIGVKAGKGKMEDKAIFICETEDGGTFSVKMKGALDDLIKYLEDELTWRGKHLTVQYQNLSTDGIPRFPVGLRIREDV